MRFNRRRTKPLSNVDVAWYQMEDPTNLMMITGVIMFDEPMDFERLKSTLDYRLVQRFRRFRRRIVETPYRIGRPYWMDDPTFDLDAHIHEVALPEPGDQDALQDMVSDLMSAPLDFSKPPWQFHLIHGFGEGSALLARLHHSIGDGIALIKVMLSLTDTEADAPLPTPEQKKPKGWDPLAPITRPARSAIKFTGRAVKTTVKVTRSVVRDPENLVNLARVGTDAALTTGRLLLMSPDPDTIYKGSLGVSKRATWSEPIPLSEIKLIGRGVGGTVNDVLMSAATGAMRRYMIGRDEDVDDLNFRSVIPVNLRRESEELSLGNKFGLVFLSLPIGVEDPVDRLRELKRRMDDLKGTTEPLVAFGILNMMGMMPDRLEDVVAGMFGTKATLVMTNVPGPREQLYLAGAPIEQMVFWVPQSGRLGLGISILSYNGQVTVGVASDTGLVPDPEVILHGFREELHALKDEMRARLMETATEFDIPVAGEPVRRDSGQSDPDDTETPVAEPTQADLTLAKPSARPEHSDHLTRIAGIGQTFATRLYEAGINTFEELAACTEKQLAAVIEAPDWRRPDYRSWIEEARALAGSTTHP
ncbi:MAG: wax ester/triacylglycerol synthase family O-acyltransferase [Chloroflexota bacterium]|nr:wax ester/triacylglycerol synthase family O-acyltransferase [Chloroflexota bacterium]